MKINDIAKLINVNGSVPTMDEVVNEVEGDLRSLVGKKVNVLYSKGPAEDVIKAVAGER